MRLNVFNSNNKKIIAREIFFVSIWLIGSFFTFLITSNLREKYRDESDRIELLAENSYIDYCEETYNYLEEKDSWVTDPHTLESFTQEVKNNKEFLKSVYERICFYDSKFENKHSLTEFSDLINTTTFLYNGKELNKFEKDKIASDLADKIRVIDSLNYEVFFLGFLLLFPFRAFVYLLIWAYKTLVN